MQHLSQLILTKSKQQNIDKISESILVINYLSFELEKIVPKSLIKHIQKIQKISKDIELKIEKDEKKNKKMP